MARQTPWSGGRSAALLIRSATNKTHAGRQRLYAVHSPRIHPGRTASPPLGATCGRKYRRAHRRVVGVTVGAGARKASFERLVWPVSRAAGRSRASSQLVATCGAGAHRAPDVVESHPSAGDPHGLLRPRDLDPARVDPFAESAVLVRPRSGVELRVQPRRGGHLLRIGGGHGSRLRHGVLGCRIRHGPQLQQTLGVLRRRRTAAHGGTDARRRRTGSRAP